MITFTVEEEKKLSKTILNKYSSIPYGKIMKFIREKDIKVNGKRVNQDITLEEGDIVEIYYNLEENIKKKESYSIVFTDQNILVVDKKSGFTSEEVFNDVLSKFSTAKFIHRLDRNTSGIMIFALNDVAEKELLFGFKNRTFKKFYIAEVMGKMPKKEDILTAYLIKDSDNSLVKIFSKEVKGSILIKTGYKVIKERNETSILKVQLFTGKTHQIRAHLSFIGHPIVGDGKYGDNEFNKKMKAKSQMLDAVHLQLFFEKESSPLYYLNGKIFEKENNF